MGAFILAVAFAAVVVFDFVPVVKKRSLPDIISSLAILIFAATLCTLFFLDVPLPNVGQLN